MGPRWLPQAWCCSACATAVVLAAVVGPAHGAPAPGCTKDIDCPGAEICSAGRCTASPSSEPRSPSSAATVVVSPHAREQFDIGVRLLEDPGGARTAEAYEAFKAAYADSPSPKILGNLGLCAMMLERDGEAIDAYERYQAEVSDAMAAERRRIESDLVILRGRIGTLELTVDPPAGVLLDERIPATGAAIINRYPITGSPVTLRLRAGSHRLTVQRDGHEPARLELEIGAGAQVARRIALVRSAEAAPAPKAPVTTAPASTPPTPAQAAASPGGTTARPASSEGVPASAWAMMVVTGVLGAGAIVTGALALDRKSTYDEFSTGGSRKEAEAWRAEGEALNITTDVLLGATAASAIVTFVLFAVGPGTDDDPTAASGRSASPRSGRIDVVPWLGTATAGGSVRAEF